MAAQSGKELLLEEDLLLLYYLTRWLQCLRKVSQSGALWIELTCSGIRCRLLLEQVLELLLQMIDNGDATGRRYSCSCCCTLTGGIFRKLG